MSDKLSRTLETVAVVSEKCSSYVAVEIASNASVPNSVIACGGQVQMVCDPIIYVYACVFVKACSEQHPRLQLQPIDPTNSSHLS